MKRSRKAVKLWLGRPRVMPGYEIGFNGSKYWWESSGFMAGTYVHICAKELHRIFPHLKIKKGQGPFLVTVDIRLVKKPKTKKRVRK